jgi:diguanylate cyclase (GGDEF)-like protein/PAS domain S-box-containing protein
MTFMQSRKALPSTGLIMLMPALVMLFAAVWLSPPTLYFLGLSSYAPLHTILETFAVAVAALIFGLGWHSYSPEKPVNLLIFACLFLAVALIDVAHFLSALGMPDFVTPSGREKAINFWFAARFIAACALLLFALMPLRKSSVSGFKYWLLGGALAVTALVYWIGLFHADSLPSTYIPGKGLTPFKIGMEYFLIAVHAITVWAYVLKLNTPQPFDVPRLLSAALVMMLSELSFTLYSEVTDVFNLLGHVYKVIAYGLLYKAVFADSVQEPYLRLRDAERNAWNNKERAEVTLASIGDAVITTDINGSVENLNPVAEQLTGWSLNDARGRNLEEVFHIVNEDTGEVVDNPARRAISEGMIVGLANHTVLISRSEKRYSIEDSAAPIRDRQGNILGSVLVFHDVTRQRDLQHQVAWQAAHDTLTGLPNRMLLSDRLVQVIAHAQRQEILAVVCFVDLDHFKPINDKYGHETGDRVLVEMAERFRQVVREGDTVARLGGDEFVILLTDIHNMDQVIPALQRILDTTSLPFAHGDSEFKLTASIGVSIYPFDDVDADTLMRHADQAMYVVKERGRNGYHLFDSEQDRRAQALRIQMVRIHAALHDNELRLHYQPKVNMRTGEVIGLEALLRWQHPERGLLPPGEFLPHVENSDLIVDIGEWVVKQAFVQMNVWLQQGIRLPVSVNIAARHLQLADFVARMDTHLKNNPDILPSQLELEILESAALDDMNNVRSVMQACLDMGINFALDDFGTGYSSLAYLKQLPAQTLKIDQTFVRDILDDPDDLALTQAVIGLSTVFERKVIAEGVETAAHGVLLMRLGCDLAQGYGVSRAMPPDVVPEWVRSYKPDPEWTLWSNIPWEMADLPLLVAQHDHLRWVKQVIDSIDGIHPHIPAEQLLSTHQCRFGQWYYGQGAVSYGQVPEFAKLGKVHDEVHRVGPEIIRLHQAGLVDEARGLVPVLLDLKDKILGGIALLQQQVANLHCAEGDRVHEKN